MDFELEKIRNQIKKKKMNKKESNNYFIGYINKILFVILLTIITMILLKSSSSFKTKFYHYVYETNISFASINNLYQKYFGSPLPFGDVLNDKTQTVFEETLTYSKKEQYLDGVALSVTSNYLVPSLESGMVIFAGDKENYGYTVIIEQVNGVEVWYSNITSSLKIYDYVEKSSLVGEANELLYLTFKKDGEVLNYEDYL
jgi:stage IV sporulation protein FA